MSDASKAVSHRRTPSKPSIWLLLVYALLSALLAGRGYNGVKVDPRRRRQHHDLPTSHSAREPRHLEREQAREGGRGRRAETPWQIPWAGWKDIFWRTYAEISDDRLVAVAAGVVFYGLLAIFPGITALVSMYGLFADASTISEHLSLLGGLLPQGALDIVQEQIARITSKGDATLGLGFVLGLALALWSANTGMKALIDALNVIYDEKEERGIIRLNLTSLTLTLGAILSLLLAIGAVIILPLLLNYVGSSGLSEMLGLLRWPALLVLVIVGLAVIYRLGPSRAKARWEWLTVGSLFAAVAWLVASALLSWYLANFADYNATYGSLGAAIGLMMWLWISSIVLLFGAELNSEIEHQTARDSTVGREKPLGARGATMADTVGSSSE